MARYFFHFEHAGGIVPDRDGAVIDDPASILAAARARVEEFVTDPRRLCDWGKAAFRIVDEAGSMCLVVSVLSLLEPRRQAA